MDHPEPLQDAQWCRQRFQELQRANMQGTQLTATMEGLQALFQRAISLTEFRLAAACAMLLCLDYKRLGEWESSVRWAEQARDIATQYCGWDMASRAARTLARVTYEFARESPSEEIFDNLIAQLSDAAEQDGQHEMFDDQADKYGFLSDVELLRTKKLDNISSKDAFQKSLSWLAKAEDLIPQLPQELQLACIAENVYKKSNAYYAIDDIPSALVCTRNACTLFEQAGKERETALMYRRIGQLELLSVELHLETVDSSLNETLRNFKQSEAFLKTAGFREQLAQCYLQQAWVWERALIQGQPGALEHALRNLDSAELIRNEIRMDFTIQRDVDSLTHKQALVGQSADMYELGFKLSLEMNDTKRSWWWLQQGRARGLLDLLGFGADIPESLIADISRDQTSAELWKKELTLLQKISDASPLDRFQLRAELTELRRRMSNIPNLYPALVYRGAQSLGLQRLNDMFQGRTDVVCVDWAIIHNAVFMSSVRPGEDPKIVELSIGFSDVSSWMQTNLKAAQLRQKAANDRFRKIDALVSPLNEISKEGELLVFCPTGTLSGLPLHALRVGGKLIVERNPVIYSNSLSILQHCLQRRGEDKATGFKVAVIGNPTGDRAAAAESALSLGALMETDPLIASAVTTQAFKSAAEGADIVHYHGHVAFNVNEPLESAFKLHEGKLLTARDVFNLHLRAKLFTMIACESGKQNILPGDEPTGLLPMILLAGANAAIGTLWNCWDTAGKEFTEAFYHIIRREMAGASSDQGESFVTIDLALALREAVLKVRKQWPEPYFWALFILHGNWTCRLSNRCMDAAQPAS
jgi:CHAT domain-containing protein